MMNQLPNVTVALVRCSYTRRPFGIRFEELKPGVWAGRWAFAIGEDRARREGYDRRDIRGRFGFSESYPGCPFCQATGVLKCGNFAQLSCWDGQARSNTCAKCGRRGEVRGDMEQMRAGGDL